MRTEVSAGGVVFRRHNNSIEFAMLQDPYEKWAFPKGHVRRAKKESYEDAASREVQEELGLRDAKFIAPLGTIEIWFKDRFVHKGVQVHKFIHYFLFEARENSRLQKTTKQREERIKDVAWVPASELRERCDYDDLDPILEETERILGLS